MLDGAWSQPSFTFHGRYYDVGYTNSNILFAAINATGIGAGTIFSVTNPNGIVKADGTLFQVGDPISTIASQNEAGGALPLNSHIASPRIRQPYSDQFSIGWSHQLGEATVFDVDYIHSDGKDLGWRIPLNQRNPGSAVRQFADIPFSPANITIEIIDDVPTALNDSNSLGEDDVSVGGNVLTNDIGGADGGKTVTTAGTSNGSYGQLILGADGAYTYTLNTANPLVQGLDNGETLTEPMLTVFAQGRGLDANDPAARQRALDAGHNLDPDHVLTDDETRRLRTRGKSTPDLLRQRAGDLSDAPDAVVLPPGARQGGELVFDVFNPDFTRMTGSRSHIDLEREVPGGERTGDAVEHECKEDVDDAVHDRPLARC